MLKPKRFIYNIIKPLLPDEKISRGSISNIPADSRKDSKVNNPVSTPIEVAKADIIRTIEDSENQAASFENPPPEELDQRKKQLIAKLIEKTDQNQQFKALIQQTLFFIQQLSLIQNSISPDADEKLPPTLNENHFLRLTPIELQFLINTPPELFNISLISDIFLQKAGHFKDNINGTPTTIIFYRNRLKVLGSGGLAEVSACLYAKLPKNEEEAETVQLKEGAIKIITRQNIDEAIKYATKSELDTLSEIRESGEYEGLIEPIFIGSNTLIDNEGNPATQEHFSITKIIRPLQDSETTFLSNKILATHPPEKTIGFIREACGGLQKIHELGRVHWDIKLSNILVGTSNSPEAPEQGKLGDLACPKVSADFIRSLIISTFKQYEQISFGHGKYHDVTIPYIINPLDIRNNGLSQIIVTHPNIIRASRHLRLFNKWVKTRNPEIIPPEIIAIVDMGLMAECLDEVCEIFASPDSTKLFPSEKIQRKTVADLTKVMERLDNIPDAIQTTAEEINTIHKELNNPILLEEQEQPLKKRLEKIQKKLQKLISKRLMTAEKLEAELERIENMIISNR